MDPTELLKRIIDSLENLEQDPDDTDERAQLVYDPNSMASWLSDNGFPPDVEEALTQAGYPPEDET